MDYSKIRFIGKHIKKNNHDYFSYSGCGFEFAVKPTYYNCSIELYLISETREHDHQYIAIYINNEFHSKEKLISGRNYRKIYLSNASDFNIIKITNIKFRNNYKICSLYKTKFYKIP